MYVAKLARQGVGLETGISRTYHCADERQHIATDAAAYLRRGVCCFYGRAGRRRHAGGCRRECR
jgi:hypothetical protein